MLRKRPASSTHQPKATRASQDKTRSLWRNQNFLFLWSGQMVSATGSQVSLVAFPALALLLTGSSILASWISAARILPYLFFGLPAGALVDRWDRKRVMLACDTIRALVLASIPLALLFDKLTIYQLFLASFVEGTLFIFFAAAETACLPHIVPTEQLPTATAQNEFIYATAGLAGPSLSGLLMAIGRMLPFLADAVSYLFSVISLLFIHVPARSKDSTPEHGLANEIKAGLLWLWRQPTLRFLALLVAGLNFATAGYLLILLVWARIFQASETATGLVVACSGAGWVIGAFLAAPLARRFPFANLLISATWIWAVSWLLFAIPTTTWMLGAATLLAFPIVPVHTSLQYTYRLKHIPDNLQGRVNTIIRLLIFGAQTLGFPCAGLLLQLYGPACTVLLLFLPQCALAILATCYLRQRHRKW